MNRCVEPVQTSIGHAGAPPRTVVLKWPRSCWAAPCQLLQKCPICPMLTPTRPSVSRNRSRRCLCATLPVFLCTSRSASRRSSPIPCTSSLRQRRKSLIMRLMLLKAASKTGTSKISTKPGRPLPRTPLRQHTPPL